MTPLDYIWMGVLAVFQGEPLFVLLGAPVSVTIVMVVSGFLTGVVVGATPGLAGPTAMAIALPILISSFGFTPDALLPVLGFLIGVMKGATVGGAVPAILFNTPGTPDALMTTLDGHPMAKAGRAGKALRVAHFSSAAGDTFSDFVLFVGAPFLAILVEAYLDLPEKTALILLSMAFIAAVIQGSLGKGLLSMSLGLLVAYVATGEDFYPRLSLDSPILERGFPVVAVVLGVLIIGELFKSLDDMRRERRDARAPQPARVVPDTSGALRLADIKPLLPYVQRSAIIGTIIGVLPGVGSTLAATLGYATARRRYEARRAPDAPRFGEGAPEGVAATEAANSAVSGANLIPVLSLGIPGNTAAVFLILAAESIGGLTPGPSVFRFTEDRVNPELVIAFGLFTTMMIANILNWTVGGSFMRLMSVLSRAPKHYLAPAVLLLTLTAIYAQDPSFTVLGFAIGFGVVGYVFRRLDISVLPFVIAFILGDDLEQAARRAFEATGGDPFFLVASPLSALFLVLSLAVLIHFGTARGGGPGRVEENRRAR